MSGLVRSNQTRNIVVNENKVTGMIKRKEKQASVEKMKSKLIEIIK